MSEGLEAVVISNRRAVSSGWVQGGGEYRQGIFKDAKLYHSIIKHECRHQ